MKKKLENFENRFKVFDKITGIVFIFTVFLIPTLTSFFLYLINKLEIGDYSFKNNELFCMIQLVVNLLSTIIGFMVIYFFLSQNKPIFAEKKYGIPYMYYYCQFYVLALVIAMMPFFKNDENEVNPVFNSIQTGIYILVLTAIIIGTMLTFKNIWKEITNWFKKATWKRYLAIFLGFVIVVSFNILISELMGKSDNQDQLDPFFGNSLPLKIVNFILLFCLSVLVAPLAEEMFTRYFFCYFSSNKWLGLIFSCLYFAFMHVNSTGDFEHVLPYLVTSIILTAMFFIFDGELAYTWIVHTLSNFVALIFLAIGATW